MNFSRHEWRFLAMMALFMANIAITGILGMEVSSSIEVGRIPIVPRNFINGWAWFSVAASPLIMAAGMTPAGKKDLLRWK